MKKINFKKILIFSLAIVLIFMFASCNKKNNDPEPVTYTLNFNTNGGNTIAAATAAEGATSFALPNDPVKAESLFLGWFYDNTSFTNPVPASGVPISVFGTNTQLTIYAKWIVFDDLKELLVQSLVYMNLNTGAKGDFEDLDATEEAELLGYINSLSALNSSYSLDNNFYIAEIIYFNGYDIWALNHILYLYNSVETYPNDLYPDDIDWIYDIAEYFDFDGYDLNDYILQAQLILEFDYFNVDSDDLSDYYAFYDLARKRIEYLEHINRIEEFNEMVEGLVDCFSFNDVRADKIFALANYLNDYDYDDIMIDRGYGYYQTNVSLAMDFFFDLVDEAELTTDDLALIVYKFLNYSIDKNISVLDSAEDEQQIAMLEDLQDAVTLSMITDIVEISFGIASIFYDSNSISSLWEATQEDDAPLIAEIATILSSFKQSIDDVLEAYDITDWNNIVSSLELVLDAVFEEESDYLGIFIPQNPFKTFETLSSVLGLFTQGTLDVFIENYDKVENDNTSRDIRLKPLDINNIAILEAKLLAILLDDYTESGFRESIENTIIFSYMAASFLPESLYADMIIPVSEALFSILQDKILISELNFVLIDTLAYSDFNPAEPVDEATINTLIFTRFIYNVYNYEVALEDILVNIGLYDEIASVFEIAAAFYFLDVDIDKLELLSDYASNNILPEWPVEYKIVSLINGLFDPEVGFTNNEIIEIFNVIIGNPLYVLSAVDLSFLNFDNEKISDALSALNGSEADISYFILMLLNQAVSVYLSSYDLVEEELDFSILIDNIFAALDNFKDIDYADIADQEGLIAVLDNLLIIGKEVGLMYLPYNEIFGEEEIDILDNVLREILLVYGFGNTIDIIKSLLTEFLDSGGPALFDFEEGISPDLHIFLSKVICLLFADDNDEFDNAFDDAIIAAGEDNIVADILQAIIDAFEDFVILAGFDYGIITYDPNDEEYSDLVFDNAITNIGQVMEDALSSYFDAD